VILLSLLNNGGGHEIVIMNEVKLNARLTKSHDSFTIDNQFSVSKPQCRYVIIAIKNSAPLSTSPSKNTNNRCDKTSLDVYLRGRSSNSVGG